MRMSSGSEMSEKVRRHESGLARRTSCPGVLAWLVLSLAAVHAAGAPGSWSQWRGPNRDGTTTAFAAPASWPPALAERWRTKVGLGHASPVIEGGRVYVHARQGDREVVTALDLETGRQVWSDAYEAPYRINPAAAAHGPGPKSTPAATGGALFTFGISGILTAYDTATGKVRWRTRPVQDQPVFGTATSPLVDGAHVIVHVGGQESGALTAFDAATGEVRWRWTGGAPAYASPVIATFGGVRQLVTQSRTHVVGVAAADGRLLWEIPFTTPYDQNAVTPLVLGDTVIYSGLSGGTTAVRPRREGQRWTVAPVWKNDEVALYMTSPVAQGTTLFGLSHRNRGQFFALDAETGKTLWTTRGREADNAALVAIGGAILALTTNSELIVLRPSATAFEEVRRYDVAPTPTWAHPALDGRRIVVKDQDSVIAWDVR
jgi:outer membrane protein assembly factor BamB